jgi:hypothetical protein
MRSIKDIVVGPGDDVAENELNTEINGTAVVPDKVVSSMFEVLTKSDFGVRVKRSESELSVSGVDFDKLIVVVDGKSESVAFGDGMEEYAMFVTKKEDVAAAEAGKDKIRDSEANEAEFVVLND